MAHNKIMNNKIKTTITVLILALGLNACATAFEALRRGVNGAGSAVANNQRPRAIQCHQYGPDIYCQ